MKSWAFTAWFVLSKSSDNNVYDDYIYKVLILVFFIVAVGDFM